MCMSKKSSCVIFINWWMMLTSSAEFKFRAGSCTFLIVPNEALVHTLVFLLYRFNPILNKTVELIIGVFTLGHYCPNIWCLVWFYLKVASWCFMSLPSLSQVIVLTGLPSYLQVNTAGLPKSTVWVAGSTVAFSGAVTVNTVSTDSPEQKQTISNL